MTDPIIAADAVCPHCGASLPAAGVCPGCGNVSAARVPLQERRWFILALLVTSALFLGFPLLWRSRRFSRGEKVLWTVIVSIESIAVFWFFFWQMARLMQQIQTTIGH